MSRRAMLAGAGGVAGAVALAGAGANAALAAENSAGLVGVPYTPGALTSGYSYRFYSGYSFIPHDSTNTYLTSGGAFAFTGATNDFATLPLDLPPGAVLREVEVYGNRTGAGGATHSVWKTDGPAVPGLSNVGSATVPAALGQFTTRITMNELITNDRAWSTFILCGSYITLYGVRVGYTGPSQLYLLPAPVRVYDSRPGAGGEGPFLVGVTRTINCATGPAPTSTPAVPASATGALLTVTIDGTVGGGFLQVYSEALTTPPSASSANWYTNGQSQANAVSTAVNGSKIKVTCGGNPGASTNVLVDVVGYYQ